MIQVTLTNDILRRITAIEQRRFQAGTAAIPVTVAGRLRKNSRKRSSYASNRLEGNPLSEAQADAAIESDPHRHFLKPEQEVRNYYMALELLEKKRRADAPFTKELLLEVQALVEKGASGEKIGLRGPMPPGVLFAVYDEATGTPDYIPPEYSDIPALLDELIRYAETTDDHPLIVAAVVHYQLVTIHPFEDGNGRTARLLSGYVLDRMGYGFGGIGSLEEYFAYDAEEYYRSLQMELPALYYSGRNDPPHSEIWVDYFLRMVELYAARVCELLRDVGGENLSAGLSHLSGREKELLTFLLKERLYEFTPIEVSRRLDVSNKTVINRCAKLVQSGFLVPVIVKERVRSYRISDFARDNERKLLKQMTEATTVLGSKR